MTTITKKKLLSTAQFGPTPYGNVTQHRFNVTTNASGVWIDGDSAAAGAAFARAVACDQTLITAQAQAEAFRPLVGDRAAVRAVVDAHYGDAFEMHFEKLMCAKLGLRAVDGVTTQDDADYFHAALVVNAVGRYRADNTAVAPLVLARDMYVVMDWDVASNAAVGILDVFVYGVDTGAP